MLLASVLREENAALISYYENELRNTGVNLRLGERIDAAKIRAMKPEIVVLATGAAAVLPDPGVVKSAGAVSRAADIGNASMSYMQVIRPGSDGKIDAAHLKDRGRNN